MPKKPYDFILPNLAVGSFESRLDPIFKAVVTLISPIEIRYISQTCSITTPAEHVLHIPIPDGEFGITPYLDSGYEFIDKHLENGPVLVHCRAGISRSPSMVAHYISKKQDIHPIDAVNIVKKKRPMADPYSGFVSEILQKYMIEKVEKGKEKEPEPTEGMAIVQSL